MLVDESEQVEEENAVAAAAPKAPTKPTAPKAPIAPPIRWSERIQKKSKLYLALTLFLLGF